MSKVMPYLGAGLAALAMAWSTPSMAQDQFKDLDPKHWAYEAVTELQQKGILLGYPDGYFKGKRTLTRYEFAIALKRLLEKLPAGGTAGAGPAGPAGAPGDAGPAGPQGPPGMTPEEVLALRKLTDEFKNELTSLGANIRDINNRLDGLAKDLKDLTDRVNRMPKIGGNFFVGVRTDRSRFNYFDYSGAFRPHSPSNFSAADVVHDFHLTVAAPLGTGGAKFYGDLMFSNYLSYRGGTLTGGPAAVKAVGVAGGSNYAETITPYQAKVTLPVGVGANGELTVGRFENKATPLTYMRPDYDSYFDLNTYDNGSYVGDGIKLSAKFGSATSSIWATSDASVVSNFGGFEKPLIGTGPVPFGLAQVIKPTGLILPQAASNQNAGIHLGVPLGFGSIGVTAIAFSTSAPVASLALPYNTVIVYGANFKGNPGKFSIEAEAAKSVTQRGFSNSDGQSNDDNNAYHAGVGYNTGPVMASAGYNYIDPRFAAPGDWLKIGNWYNPTNVRGPYAKIGYKLSNSLDIHIGGDVLEGARNRPGFFVIDDAVRRVKAGVNFKVSRSWSTSLDYEGVFYSLSGGTSATGVNTKPVEQYITLGAGVNLASNTKLKFGYQIINFQNVGNGFGAGTGYPAGFGVGGGGNSSNASVFTTQVAVHF